MKTIIAFLIGLSVSAIAFAYSSPLSVVEHLRLENHPGQDITKIYDSNKEVTCYVYTGYRSGGISCIK